MPTIDFSGADTEFDATDARNIDHAAQLSYSSAHYSWRTISNFVVTAHSASGDITANAGGPLGGTISAINVIDDDGKPAFSITGLAVSLPSLVSTSDAAVSHERFWEAVLSGETTFIMPSNDQARVFGDFVTVNAGQNLTGANDEFLGTGQGSASHVSAGDAETVKAGATLNGGDDRFVDVSGQMVGDVGSGSFGPSYGTVIGGKDSFIATSNPLKAGYGVYLAVGDVYENAFNVTGGADTFTFTDVPVSQGIAGDVYIHLSGTVVGGDDSITVARTGVFETPFSLGNVSGDVMQANANAAVKGGNDVLSISDALAGTIVGDVAYSGGNVTGGNDRIDFSSKAPFFAGPPVVPGYPYAAFMAGDAGTIVGGTFLGGSDVLTVTNAITGAVVGDAYSLLSGATSGKGGNDTISMSWNQVNIATSALIQMTGDFASVAGGAVAGGDDTIRADLLMGADRNAYLSGDTLTAGSTSFVGGNDTIVLNSNRLGGTNLLFGDAKDVLVTGQFRGGNDRITGSNGADKIYGDAETVTAGSYVGGNDVLDGRGGNDFIDGGLGFDTAVYSSLNQAVFVNLNGIPGSATNPANWAKAIGQGFDQLRDIEAIIGSQLGDTVIGDGLANVFDGLGGNDQLAGGGGDDTLRGGTGNDRLDGGSGVDRMSGGAGNDVYVVDSISDKVDESAVGSDGVDTVLSAISFNLANAGSVFGAVESLVLTGSASVHGTGNAINNALIGNAGANVLNGLAGNDALNGGAGNDLLNGGAGRDTLTGGLGNDTFLFNAPLNAATNVDRVADFFGPSDTIALENAVFAKLAVGTLSAAAFRVGTAAADATDRIVYNKTTGALIYDSNGNVSGGAVQFATLEKGLALNNADFVVI
jgi:serralysin